MRSLFVVLALVAAPSAWAGKDLDGDGIKDKKDSCPDLAEDYDEYQDEDGCPEWPVPIRPPHLSKPGVPDPSCFGVVFEVEQSFDGKILRFICADGTGIEARPKYGVTPQEIVPELKGTLYWVHGDNEQALWQILSTADGELRPDKR